MKRNRWCCKFLVIAIVFPLLVAAQPAGAPKFTSAGVVNAASSAPGMSPGSFIRIFGENLAPATRSWEGAIKGTALPSQLEGVSVTVAGQPAYLRYISPKQLVVLTPGADMTGPVELQVTTAQGHSTAITVIERYAPDFFLLDGKYVSAMHADKTFAAKVGEAPDATSRPAQPGEEITLLGTGFGPTAERVPSGQVLTKAYPLANLADLKVSIGGNDARVTFAGVTSAGIYEIHAVIPAELADGDHAVQAAIGGIHTQENAFITVQRPSAAAAVSLASIQVCYRLDPWLISGNYGSGFWVCPPSFGPVNQGGTAFVLETSADGLDASGQIIPISPQWIPSDSAMVTVSPNQGTPVTLTVQQAGQSKVQVATQGIATELAITAVNLGYAMQVTITAAPVVFPPTQGLIGYWNFDEGSGSIAHDTSGSGYSGKVTGATWTAGRINSALSFNGTTDNVATPNILLANAFSICAWVNPAVTSEGRYATIAQTHFSGGLYLGTDASGARYKFVVNTGLGTTGSCGARYGCAQGGTITSGWHLVTGTFDGATAKLYVDNAVVASDTFTAPPPTSYHLHIGGTGSNGYAWNGAMDEVRLYNRALTDAEVSDIFNYHP